MAVSPQAARRELVRRAGPAQRREHVEVAVAQPDRLEHRAELVVQRPCQSVQAADQPHRRDVEVGPFTAPLHEDPADMVQVVRGDRVLAVRLRFGSSMQGIYLLRKILSCRMDTSFRTAALTAIAPSPGAPPTSSPRSCSRRTARCSRPPSAPCRQASRSSRSAAVADGLVVVARRRPRGRQHRCFFPLLFIAAYHLPGGLASTLQASSPLVVMAFALWLLRERPGRAGWREPWSARGRQPPRAAGRGRRRPHRPGRCARLGRRLRARLRPGQALDPARGHGHAGVLAAGRGRPRPGARRRGGRGRSPGARPGRGGRVSRGSPSSAR